MWQEELTTGSPRLLLLGSSGRAIASRTLTRRDSSGRAVAAHLNPGVCLASSLSRLFPGLKIDIFSIACKPRALIL